MREEIKPPETEELSINNQQAFYLIVVVQYYLVNGTAEVWDPNIRSGDEDPGSQVFGDDGAPGPASKVKEGISELQGWLYILP